MFKRLSRAAAARSTGWLGIIVPAAYAALVIVVTLVVIADRVFVDHEDASLIGVWLIAVTLPLSGAGLLALAGLEGIFGEMPGPLGFALFIVATTGPGLAQVWLLRLVTRGRLREPTDHHAPAP
ncbi:SCO4225 family membrane protein [Spirillospora sp. NPDC048911]|uniref:SCO4225 family membrane protein n=1 Tax=Spirillospora sp. NPDC048911 TaxID=3364527 RepID=UPI0037131E76